MDGQLATLHVWIERNFVPPMSWDNRGTVWELRQLVRGKHWGAWAPLFVGQVPDRAYLRDYLVRLLLALEVLNKEDHLPDVVFRIADCMRPDFVFGPALRGYWAEAKVYDIIDSIRDQTPDGGDLMGTTGANFLNWCMFQVLHSSDRGPKYEPRPVVPRTLIGMRSRAGRALFMHWTNWAISPRSLEDNGEHLRLLSRFCEEHELGCL